MEYCNTFNTIITCTEWKYNDLSHKSFVVKKGEVLFDIDKSNANEEKVDFDINSKVALIEQAFENEQLDNMDGG